MNSGIKTFYALKWETVRTCFFFKKKSVLKVVGITNASSWLWAEKHFFGIKYDELVTFVH